MTIYHFQKDANLLRSEVLPKKKLFIVDAYNTLFLSDPVRKIQFVRNGANEFFQAWDNECVICSDGKEEEISKELLKYGLSDLFSKVYDKKSLSSHESNKNRVFKRYEAITRGHGYNLEDAIIIEDWDPNDHRLNNIDIDYIIIPTPITLFSCLSMDRRHLISEALKRKKLENGYTFRNLFPIH